MSTTNKIFEVLISRHVSINDTEPEIIIGNINVRCPLADFEKCLANGNYGNSYCKDCHSLHLFLEKIPKLNEDIIADTNLLYEHDENLWEKYRLLINDDLIKEIVKNAISLAKNKFIEDNFIDILNPDYESLEDEELKYYFALCTLEDYLHNHPRLIKELDMLEFVDELLKNEKEKIRKEEEKAKHEQITKLEPE